MSDQFALDLLSQWPKFAGRDFWTAPGDSGCYGTGYNGWGVQTNQKFMGAMALLATDADFDADLVGLSQAEVLDWALKSLRFSLATHHTGASDLADGTRWGRTWISVLGIERMMHGVHRVWDHLTDADRVSLHRVLTDEANHQVKEEIKAGVWGDSGRNKPESNIWNGAICARAAAMYPDDPNAAAWTDRAHDWFVNGISIAADAEDTTEYGGKTVKQRHIGANFFPHFSLDHHAYLNVGYMVICLSNVAMLHYALPQGHPFPSLYHHAQDLWHLVKRLIFSDGRLCRIGGDTRQRYCYCQDYLLPVLVFAADVWRDTHAMGLLNGQLNLIAQEMDYNNDGSFLSRRLHHIFRLSPHYATRLESDKAVVLSMVRDWLPGRDVAMAEMGDFESAVAGGWAEPEHGAVCHRSRTRIASFAWRAAEGPMGLCLSPHDGHLAEWMENLSGEVRLLGAEGKLKRVERREIAPFEGGFLTWGRMSDSPKRVLREGWASEEDWVWHDLVFAALPDGHTVVRLEHARLIEGRRTYLDALLGVKLEVPNDLFNLHQRVYRGAFGEKVVLSHQGEQEVVVLPSPWVNVDDKVGAIGLYGAEAWTLLRRGHRVGGYAGSVLTDALCYPAQVQLTPICGPATLLDTGALILASADAEVTQQAYSANREARIEVPDPCRAVRIAGRDGRVYLLTANFGDQSQSLSIDGQWKDLATGENTSKTLNLDAGQARVFGQ